MWLFKPSIKISYSASTSYAIPKTASIHAAKVLYKLLGPSEGSSDLKGYFDQLLFISFAHSWRQSLEYISWISAGRVSILPNGHLPSTGRIVEGEH